jgi:amino acid adenylation domain-containing protein
MTGPGPGLVGGVLAAAARHPERDALEVGGQSLSYRELIARAAALAAALGAAELASAQGTRGRPALTGVLAHRSLPAFTGVLAALLRGHGYVPLQPQHPPARLAEMIGRAACRTVVVDRAGLAVLDEILAGVDGPLVIIAPEVAASDGGAPDDAEVTARLAALRARWPAHRFLDAAAVPPAPATPAAPSVAPEDIAYLLFTSGSTGRPKAVMVGHGAACHFIDGTRQRYAVGPDDRLSQTFDLTFDLSVFDMFIAWWSGACLCCPSEGQKVLPATYIQRARLTVWFSVPSVAVGMARLRMLRPGQYPGLRLSLFCGEALPVEVAQAWQAAAPRSRVENLYGPTELTVACTAYSFDAESSPRESAQGVVPIGTPLPGMTALVVDDHLREVAPGADGELIMTGPQLCLGYLDDRERTAAAFVVPPDDTRVHYRTGDRVRRPAVAGAPLLFLGRLDSQIKVRGYRVELGEIEAALRAADGVHEAAAVPWPRTPAGFDGVIAFVTGNGVDVDALTKSLLQRLPSYMRPTEIRLVSGLPHNANQKIDRRALAELLETS